MKGKDGAARAEEDGATQATGGCKQVRRGAPGAEVERTRPAARERTLATYAASVDTGSGSAHRRGKEKGKFGKLTRLCPLGGCLSVFFGDYGGPVDGSSVAKEHPGNQPDQRGAWHTAGVPFYPGLRHERAR